MNTEDIPLFIYRNYCLRKLSFLLFRQLLISHFLRKNNSEIDPKESIKAPAFIGFFT